MTTVYITYYSHLQRLIPKELFDGKKVKTPFAYRYAGDPSEHLEDGRFHAREDVMEQIRISPAWNQLAKGTCPKSDKSSDESAKKAIKRFSQIIENRRFDPIACRPVEPGSKYPESYEQLHQAGILRKQFFRDRLGALYEIPWPDDPNSILVPPPCLFLTAGVCVSGMTKATIIALFNEDEASETISSFVAAVDNLTVDKDNSLAVGKEHIANYAQRALLKEVPMECLISRTTVIGRNRLGKGLYEVLRSKDSREVFQGESCKHNAEQASGSRPSRLDRTIAIVRARDTGASKPAFVVESGRGSCVAWSDLSPNHKESPQALFVRADRDVRIVEFKKDAKACGGAIEPEVYARAVAMAVGHNAELVKVYDHLQGELEKIVRQFPSITETIVDCHRVRSSVRERMTRIGLRISRMLDVAATARTSRQDAALSRDAILRDILVADDDLMRIGSLEDGLNQSKHDIENWLHYLNDLIDQRVDRLRALWFAIIALMVTIPSFVGDSFAASLGIAAANGRKPETAFDPAVPNGRFYDSIAAWIVGIADLIWIPLVFGLFTFVMIVIFKNLFGIFLFGNLKLHRRYKFIIAREKKIIKTDPL